MKRIIGIILFCSLQPAFLKAELDTLPMGARALAMSEAFVAVADDASAISYNPAGLSQLRQSQILAYRNQLLSTLTDGSQIDANSLIYALPINIEKKISMGFAYQNFKGANFFNDWMVRSGGAMNVTDEDSGILSGLAIGAGVKYGRRTYQENSFQENSIDDFGNETNSRDPLFSDQGNSMSRFGIDIGALYRFGEDGKTSIGYSHSNLVQTTSGVGSQNATAPSTIRVGLASQQRHGVLGVEVRRVSRLSNENDIEATMGIERDFPLPRFGQFSLRGGFGKGTRGFESLTMGISLKVSLFQIDYGVSFPVGNLTSLGTSQIFSLGMTFDGHGRNFSSTKASQSSARLVDVVNFENSINHYYERKLNGASAQEKLSLLQELYSRFGSDQLDQNWFSSELTSL